MSVFGTIIGVGQCGTRIGAEFEKIGYNVKYINTDIHDVVNKENTLLLDTEGTGCSVLKGQQLAEQNRNAIIKLLKSISKESDSILCIGGAGGGTGGGVVPFLLELCHNELEFKKVGTLLTLPLSMLDILAMSNAMKTLKQVKNYSSYLMLADNQYLIDKLGVGTTTFWSNVNNYIVTTVSSLDKIYDESKTSFSGMGSIDKEEVSRLLHTTKGLCDISIVYLPDTTLSLDTEVVIQKLFEPSLIQGLDYKKTTAYICCIDTPPNTSLYNHVAMNIFDQVKKKHGNAISRLGMFQTSLVKEGGILVTRFSAGLDYPKVIQSRIKNLKRDEERFLTKRSQTRLTSLDESDFVDLDEI